jgi:hypothetical protein
MQGVPLAATIAGDVPIRQAALFGMHSLHMNVTDGRYVYMRAPVYMDTCPVYNYTLMPTHMRKMFTVEELQDITLSEPFDFSKGCRLLKVKAPQGMPWGEPMEKPDQTMLFDLKKDPGQEAPIQDREVEKRMIEHMVQLMRASDAPAELYERFGLTVWEG